MRTMSIVEPQRENKAKTLNGPKVVGLFAGVGGIELGLHRSIGGESILLCENNPSAALVLKTRFPNAEFFSDVRELQSIPTDVDILTAGFPCQDLSQAGKTRGIKGENSGLVDQVFRLLSGSQKFPTWLLIENVPFMLQLDKGRAMKHLTESLERLGFRWAYRIVDARSFGVPQRRRRVILLASATENPSEILFSRDAGVPEVPNDGDVSAYGFYWTEGTKGLGWAPDAVPTLKGGSTIGIPSPPAVWIRSSNEIVTPDLRDAERLQGFQANWTLEALAEGGREGIRWKLVGNAVCVPVAKWIGDQLSSPKPYDYSLDSPLKGSWPCAARGEKGKVFQVRVSEWPCRKKSTPIADFFKFETKYLSQRAASGFLSRARAGYLRFHPEFLDAVESHIEFMRGS